MRKTEILSFYFNITMDMCFNFPNGDADDRLASVVVFLSSESSALLVTLNSVCALGYKKHFNDLLKFI